MIYGNDISHWQNDKTYKYCYDNSGFLIMKASESTAITDRTFKKRILECIKKGKNVGAYHFYLSNSRIDWQAENFISTVLETFEIVKSFYNYEKIPYMLALDVEQCVVDMNKINKFLDYVEIELKQRPVIYMSLSDYMDNKLYNDKKNKYWIASWSKKTKDIFKYENVIMHQCSNYTKDNYGKKISLDCDVYKYDNFLF